SLTGTGSDADVERHLSWPDAAAEGASWHSSSGPDRCESAKCAWVGARRYNPTRPQYGMHKARGLSVDTSEEEMAERRHSKGPSKTAQWPSNFEFINTKNLRHHRHP